MYDINIYFPESSKNNTVGCVVPPPLGVINTVKSHPTGGW